MYIEDFIQVFFERKSDTSNICLLHHFSQNGTSARMFRFLLCIGRQYCAVMCSSHPQITNTALVRVCAGLHDTITIIQPS